MWASIVPMVLIYTSYDKPSRACNNLTRSCLPLPPLILSIGHGQLCFFIRNVCRDRESFLHVVKQLFLHVDCINKADTVASVRSRFHFTNGSTPVSWCSHTEVINGSPPRRNPACYSIPDMAHASSSQMPFFQRRAMTSDDGKTMVDDSGREFLGSNARRVRPQLKYS
jgi:hypothetical protein